MNARPRWLRPLVIGLAIIGLVLPPAFYWLAVGRAPGVTVAEARAILASPESRARLVDIRPAPVYAANHLEGAENWPSDQILATASPDQVPASLRGSNLFLLCDSGIRSGFATRHLQAIGIERVMNVQGGLQAWVGAGESPCGLSFCRLRAVDGATTDLPIRESPRLEQWAAVVTGFGIKPAYMLLSLVLVGLLWRRTSPDLAAMRWAMIFFFVGEAWCALNYLLYRESSPLFEFLHSYGMVLSFGFATFAVLEAADRRFIRYSDPRERCAALALCRGCIKYAAVPCAFKRCFLLIIPAMLVLALMPFAAEPNAVSYNTRILGTFYNYTHAVVHQIYEIRFCPAAAFLLLAASLAVLSLAREEAVLKSKVFFAAGVGALGFGFFRLFLFAPYRENLVWFAFWEEITEFLFVLAVGVVLWIFWKPKGKPGFS